MLGKKNRTYMQLALTEAEKAFAQNETPIGSVIVDRVNKLVIASSHNSVETENDFLRHAEINAINIACSKLNSKYLLNCDMYVTLQPCIFCINAVRYSRISRLFYGAKRKDNKYIQKFYNFNFNKQECFDCILEIESQNLLKQFFKSLR